MKNADTQLNNLKPYPKMKDSGNPWLGQVPEHWHGLKLRSVLKAKTERNRSDLPLLSVVREKGVIVRNVADDDENHNYVPDDLTNYKVVRKGQFVMNKMKAWQGSYGVSSFHGIVSPAYFVFDLSGVSGDFFHLAMRSRAYIPLFTQASDGVRIGQWDLAQARMREIPFFVPPPDEQAAIVRFLNHADRRIRRYIAAKQKLIKLLEEQKQAIIHQAVTCGLDPNVPLKPSGIEWLGDVPEHWEVLRVKQVCAILRGKFTFRPRNDPSLYDGPYPFIQTGDVARAEKSIKTYRQTLNEKGFSVSKMFPAGTLVMTIAANIGDVAVLDFPACFPDSIVGFKPTAQLDRDYLYNIFVAMKSELLREAPVNTQGNLNIDRVGGMEITVPPVLEQRLILQQIATNTAYIDSAIKKARTQCTLLQEYRTRLIAEVVTGKLDVREAAAALPVEPYYAHQDNSAVVSDSAELGDELEPELVGTEE